MLNLRVRSSRLTIPRVEELAAELERVKESILKATYGAVYKDVSVTPRRRRVRYDEIEVRLRCFRNDPEARGWEVRDGCPDWDQDRTGFWAAYGSFNLQSNCRLVASDLITDVREQIQEYDRDLAAFSAMMTGKGG